MYEKIIAGYLDIFEGPCTRLRPSFKLSVLNSGILKIFGQMINHTLIMDGMGFPYLSPPCYYYMAGEYNTAVTLTTNEDLRSRVHHVLQQVLASYFLRIASVRECLYACVCVCVCVCLRVCPPPRLLITSGVMWRDMDSI